MCIHWGGTRVLPQDCTIAAWLLLPYLYNCLNLAPSSNCLNLAPLNSGKAEWGPYSKNKKWTQKGFCTQGLAQFHSQSGGSIRFHRLRVPSYKTSLSSPTHTIQMSVSSPSCYLYFCPTGYKLEVSTTPSLGSISLLEQLIRLRHIFLPGV